LAAPSIVGPVFECQEAVPISNVVDGALVTLTETPGSSTPVLFSGTAEMLQIKPLGPGGFVSATQSMLEGCQFEGASSAQVAVSPADQVPPPAVIGPLQAGDVYVGLNNLIPGAQVEIFQGTVSLGTGTCSANSQYFAVPPLVRKQVIQATQSLCSNSSGFSNQGRVKALASLDAPVLQRKVFQCGSTVQVSNLHPGAVIYIYSVSLGAPIGIAHATSAELEVRVAPLLTAGDQIYALQQSGSQTSAKSSLVRVKPLPNQGTPAIVAPVGAGSSIIFVQNVIAGPTSWWSWSPWAWTASSVPPCPPCGAPPPGPTGIRGGRAPSTAPPWYLTGTRSGPSPPRWR
ncbi:MAG: hypothetical protein ACREDR_47105, partial [Blastocatellia bacterium]